MDDEYPNPKLAVGDLVRCIYDLYHYYYPSNYTTHGDSEPYIRYGVIMEIDFAKFGDIFGYETLYLVLCTDGSTRYYSEYEVEKIS